MSSRSAYSARCSKTEGQGKAGDARARGQDVRAEAIRGAAHAARLPAGPANQPFLGPAGSQQTAASAKCQGAHSLSRWGGTSSCSTKPAMPIIARRPLFSSLVWEQGRGAETGTPACQKANCCFDVEAEQQGRAASGHVRTAHWLGTACLHCTTKRRDGGRGAERAGPPAARGSPPRPRAAGSGGQSPGSRGCTRPSGC